MSIFMTFPGTTIVRKCFQAAGLAGLVMMLGLAVVAAPTASRADEQRSEVGEDQARIEAIVKDYLMRHPEVIVDALEAMQARAEQAKADRQKAMIQAHADQLDDPTGRYVMGNPDGDVTVVEFFDYRCGYCKRVFPTLMQEVERDGNVRLVMKEFPILGEDSVIAARGAIAAAQQGRYYDMHVALMRERGRYTEGRVLSIATDLGLDADRMKADMYGPVAEQAISRTYEIARVLDITGTPGFIIGTELVPGAMSGERMRALIEKARSTRG